MTTKNKKQYKERFIARAHEAARILYRKNLEDVSDRHKYMCVAMAVKDTIIDDWIDTQKAFDEADADVIFVLPNNSNIIMAAKQAAGMYEKSKIMVLETKNFGQAYSVLSMLDFASDDTEEIFDGLFYAG